MSATAAVDEDARVGLVAEGLWNRLRDVVIALGRWERFVHDPDPLPGTLGAAVGTASPPSREEAARIASETVLRAWRVGVDPVNHALLARLAAGATIQTPGSATLAELGEIARVPQVPLLERINELVQAGLAVHLAGSQEVQATPAAEGMLGLMDEVTCRLAALVEERWAATVQPGRVMP